MTFLVPFLKIIVRVSNNDKAKRKIMLMFGTSLLDLLNYINKHIKK